MNSREGVYVGGELEVGGEVEEVWKAFVVPWV
jgi:hypothetical protein